MIRAWGRQLLLLLLLALLVIAATVVLISTQAGMRLGVRLAERFAPGTLRIEEVHGDLLGTLRLQGVDYRNGESKLKLDRFLLVWNPVELRHGELHIERIEIADLDLQTPPAPTEAEKPPFEPPQIELPLRVRLDAAEARNIRFTQDSSTLQIDELSARLSLDQSEARVEHLRVVGMGLTGELAGHIEPRGRYPLEASLNWAYQGADLPLIRGEGKVSGDLSALTLNHHVSQPLRLTSNGTVRLVEGEPVLDLRGDWESLRWPLGGNAAPTIASPKGSYRVQGRASAYTLGVDTMLTGAQVPEGRWTIDGRGDLGHLDIDSLHGDLLSGHVDLLGALAWSPAVHWEMEVQGDGLDPGEFRPEWPGKLSLSARSEGGMDASGVKARMHLERLEGKLRGLPVSASTVFELAPQQWRLSSLNLRSGTAQLRAEGGLGLEWDLAWQIAAPDLGQLWPDATGSLQGQGSLRGPPQAPQATVDLQGRGMRLGDASTQNLSAQGNIDLGAGRESDLSVRAGAIAIAGRMIDELTLEMNGRAEAHALQLRLNAPEGRLALEAKGGWQQHWQGKLNRLDWENPQLGAWRLQAPIDMRLGAGRAEVERACWARARARLCAGGHWDPNKGWQAAGSLEGIGLEEAQAALPPHLRLSGALAGEWKAQGVGPDWRAEARVRAESGELRYAPEDAQAFDLAWRQGTLQTRAQAQKVETLVAIELSDGATLDSEGTLAPAGTGGWSTGAVAGKLRLSSLDLQRFAALVPEVEDLAGQLRANLAVDGTLPRPRVRGEMALSGFSGKVPRAGLDLKDGQVRVRGDGGPTLRVDGGVRSGKGRLEIEGTLGLPPDREPTTEIALVGEAVQVANLPEAQVVASPNLRVRVQGAQAQVAGAVMIPEAKLTLKELPATAVPVSSDVVLAGAPAKPPGEAALRVTSDVDIRLGNKVAFSGFGLSGRIQGRLRVRERGTGAPTGQGELEIKEGRYRAYGQSLEIERGRILFAGPLANPSLDVRAVRKADEVTAGLQVSGPAEAPLADLFSDPPMEDTQILSYLVLGRSLADTSGAESALLSSAASSLGAGGAGLLSNQLQQGLGLDEVKVESEGGLEQAAVTLGRYLSPKLYVGYSMGLFESTSAVVLRYDLTKRLLIEAQSGTQSGADLFYHFEK